MTAVRVARPEVLPAASDRYVVVEASAGTGKTFFLEHRVVDLILAGASLGEILLVTFTDKAVAELRLRIRDLLDRLARSEGSTDATSAWEIDAAARARLRDAVIAFDHAPIFTIHGFCHRVLVEDAFAARRLFEQTQVADDVAFDAAFMALVRERFARVSPDRNLLGAYLRRGKTLDDLRALLLACARADAPTRAAYQPETLSALGDELRASFGDPEERGRLSALAVQINKRNAARWVELVGAAVVEWDGTPHGVPGVCERIRKQGNISPGENLIPVFEKAHPATARLLHRAIVESSPDEMAAAALLPAVLARVGADKSEHGTFDYSDMLDLVAEALHGPRGADLAARLRARTPWVMIDEFQDTDPVQWDIFRTVWMHDEARGLTLVGDPKQAIYGFRGADVATYENARDELLRNGATQVQLDVNRRSTPEMVAAVNQILVDHDSLSALFDKGSIIYDHPVKPCGDVTCEGAPITVFALPGPKGEDKTALATAIATSIEDLRRTPPVWRVRGEAQPFSLGQVLVLTRANKESGEIASVLRARGLPASLVEGDRLFETREAAELAAVLAAIAAPRDRSARLRALRTRFFDVPWAELMRVVDAPDHHPLISRLFDWAALANRRAYESLFRQLVEDSRFAERALVLGSGERAIVNTWHLIELLLAEVARSRADLHELVIQLRRWIADGADHPDDRDVQRAETDRDAIRILTIHKAKGLEAPYVFLYAASQARKSNVHTVRDGAGRSLVVDPQDEGLVRRIEAEADAENQRLAYVALTRAKVRLFLPRYSADSLKDRSTYGPIQRCLVPLVSRRHPLLDIRDVAPPGTELATPADALVGFDPPGPPAIGELAPIDGARAGLAMLSYTRLGREPQAAAIEPGELPIAIDPAEFDVEREVAAPVTLAPDELPPGIDSGLLLHDLFEHADLATLRAAPDAATWFADPTTRALIAEHARERGLAARYHQHAAKLVHATLACPLEIVGAAALPPLAHARAFAREVEFSYPLPGEGTRGLVKGYIDALVAWDDELWILDYKSDLLAGVPARVADGHARDHYAIQERLYALAADRMRGGRRLAGMLFAFVRYGVVVANRFSDAKLAEWSAWLAGLRTEVAR